MHFRNVLQWNSLTTDAESHVQVFVVNAITHREDQPEIEAEDEKDVASGGFLDKLNSGDVLSVAAATDLALRFRLPSESEWEYAARGGPHWQDDFAFSGSDQSDDSESCSLPIDEPSGVHRQRLGRRRS